MVSFYHQKRINILGVGISATNVPAVVMQVAEWIRLGQRHYVCVTGVHGVIESQGDPALKQIHNRSGLTVPDGMPMVWLCHLAGQGHVSRVYGPDLMLALCEVGVSFGYRHFFYGGDQGVPERLADSLRSRFPEMQVVGTLSPPFRPLTEEEDEAIVCQINAARPDIVWVGLGTPKQERWMAAHAGRLVAPALIGVGAAFDIHTNRLKQAPPWMRRSGLEWFYRLLQEPGRLWRRYLLGIPQFAWYLGLQLSGLRRFPLLE